MSGSKALKPKDCTIYHYSLVQEECFTVRTGSVCPRTRQSKQSKAAASNTPWKSVHPQKFPTVKSKVKGRSILQAFEYNHIYQLKKDFSLLLTSFSEHSINKIGWSPTKHQEGKDHIKGTVAIRITTKSELKGLWLILDIGKTPQEEKPRLAALSPSSSLYCGPCGGLTENGPIHVWMLVPQLVAGWGLGNVTLLEWVWQWGWAVKHQKPMPGPNAICLKQGVALS